MLEREKLQKYIRLFYQDNEPYYYFGELTSRKIVKIFDKNANLVKEISLKDQNILNESFSMYMPSMDSIVVLLGYPLRKILVTDSDGRTTFEKSFYQIIITDSVDYALDIPLTAKATLYNNKVYLINSAFKKLSYTMTTEEYVAFNKYSIKSPMICEISLDDTNKKPVYFGDDFWKKIYDNDSIEKFQSYQGLKIENNYFFYIVQGYGKILVVDLDTKKVFKVLNIKHNNKPIGIEQRIFKNYETYKKDEKEADDNWFVKNVVWDKFREVYYVFLNKKRVRTPEEQNSKQTCFIQIWDKNLNFQKEVKFGGEDSHLYEYNDVIVTEEGFMIKYYTPNKNNVVYKLFSINL